MQIVNEFFNDDEISRLMPGKNDCISIREADKKTYVQKRLILSTLKEIYEEFKKKHVDVKIGFSKFAELRPKYCVQLGSSGTHTICVCTIHQNIKLMMSNSNFNVISEQKYSTYKDCISSVLCQPPTSECYLERCINCPRLDNLKFELYNMFENAGYADADMKFNQWINTDRCSLETLVKPLEEFIEYFIEKFKKLIPHHFISKEQSNFIKNLKLTLKPNEFIVHGDFAENYSFIIQNAVQGFHWNNSQATIHPFVIYFRDEENTLQHLSFVVISDCLKHDSIAVHLFIEKLIHFLKQKFTNISKIYYITDGAAGQYKNKFNFTNIVYHLEDFGIHCEWHFHATSHGKGPCDGIGGTVKRQAARASLSSEYEKVITTPRELFDWASKHSSVNLCYVDNSEYEEKKINLVQRFQKSRTIPGTRGFHAFIPVGHSIIAKIHSNSNISKEFRIL